VSLFPLPLLSTAPGLSCVFVGKLGAARPGPADLLRLLPAPGAPSLRFARARQIHSNRCLVVRPDGALPADGVAGEGDALLTDRPGIALGVAVADCVPLAAYDPQARVLAVIHAGWRGTQAGVLAQALSVMELSLGADPSRLLVSAGPCAGACCYCVGNEVIDAFAAAGADLARIVSHGAGGETRLDLVEANRLQALAAGVREERFASAGLCTLCGPGGLHSYRREGAAAGRMWLVAAMTGDGAA